MIILTVCAFAFAQELPRIAVYVTGDLGVGEKKALGTRMLAALVNSGRYKGIERSNSFLDEIEKEQVKQRSGAIDDSQISEVGRQFGVTFVCIADITSVLGDYQVSARIVNVETAEVDRIGEASSRLKTVNDLTKVSDQVVKNMFGDAAKKKAVVRVSLGAGGLLSADLGGGIAWKSGAYMAMPHNAGGAYLFADIGYAEAFIGYSTGGGDWKSASADELPYMYRSNVNIGVLGKYPITAGRLKYYPVLGLEYAVSLSGRLKYADGTEYVFDAVDNRPAATALSAFGVKLGGGVDFGLNDRLYLRAEALYGVRTANEFETNEADDSNAKTRLGHGPALKIGLGINID